MHVTFLWMSFNHYWEFGLAVKNVRNVVKLYKRLFYFSIRNCPKRQRNGWTVNSISHTRIEWRTAAARCETILARFYESARLCCGSVLRMNHIRSKTTVAPAIVTRTTVRVKRLHHNSKVSIVFVQIHFLKINILFTLFIGSRKIQRLAIIANDLAIV